jgi:hypothetical protein
LLTVPVVDCVRVVFFHVEVDAPLGKL